LTKDEKKPSMASSRILRFVCEGFRRDKESALQQDFASRIGQEQVRPSVSRSGQFRLPKLVVPRIQPRRGVLVSAAGFSVVAMMLSLLFAGSSVDASVPVTKEEWLKAQAPQLDASAKPLKVVLRSGDAAATALEQLGFSFADVMRMSEASKEVYSLRKVNAGHAFSRRDEGDASHVWYDVDSSSRLHLFVSEEGDWQAELTPRVVSTRQVQASGFIEDSLFTAALEAGLDERTTMNLIDIFSWDVDFARDLRSGDRFSVLFEEQFDDEGKLRDTKILAAEFVNQGESYKAVRYELANGNTEYFTPEGHSMRKTYLKSPVKFSRISSRFSTSRKHPVLGYTRAHRGVDYAAASGTPIRAIGDGTVVLSQWKGGYGRYVEIRHINSAHSSAYGHLQSYGRGIKRGVRVKQGQIIGYVGMTGLATGPHLHYEFRVRGRAVNPLNVKHSPAKPVPSAELAKFTETTSPLLEKLSGPLLAMAWE